MRQIQRALALANEISERILIKRTFRFLMSYFEDLKSVTSQQRKKRRLLKELRSIDVSAAFGSSLNLGSDLPQSLLCVDSRLGSRSRRVRALESITWGTRGPLHHPRQRSVTLRYLAFPAVISASQVISRNICDKLAPVLFEQQTQLLRAVQRDEFLSWGGQLNYKVALVTAATSARFWSLSHTANFATDTRAVNGSELCSNLLRLVCCTQTARLSADDWTDEKEITIVGDGPEETSAHRLGFLKPSLQYTARVFLLHRRSSR